jgi:ribosomal protein L37AE/L43A
MPYIIDENGNYIELMLVVCPMCKHHFAIKVKVGLFNCLKCNHEMEILEIENEEN